RRVLFRSPVPTTAPTASFEVVPTSAILRTATATGCPLVRRTHPNPRHRISDSVVPVIEMPSSRYFRSRLFCGAVQQRPNPKIHHFAHHQSRRGAFDALD